jgi:ribonuclease P protein component
VERKYRICRSKDFEKLVKHAPWRSKNVSYHLYFAKNDLGYPRIGIASPKTLGNAVCRNKVRRQVRAMIGKILDNKLAIDAVIVVKPPYLEKTYQENQILLETLWEYLKKTK